MATKPDDTDAFDDAFAQFSTRKDGEDAVTSADDHSDDKKGDDDGGAGDDTAGADAGDDAATGGDDAGAGGDDGAADDKDAGAGDDDASDPNTDKDADDVLQRLSALLKDAPPAKDDKPSADYVDPNAPKAEIPELYTKEEQEFLKTYDEDWGDVTKGEALKRRAEYRELMQHVFGEVAKHMTPLAEMVTELATRTHLGDLQERVPDYNDLRDNVVEWVETQPAYLQVGMKEVMKTGTADEVADLIDRYRKDKGIADPSATPAPKQAAELSDTAKKAAASLAPVSTKRSVIPQDDGSDDFDSAFAKFAGKSK